MARIAANLMVWMQGQNLSVAEVMYLTCGLLVVCADDVWSRNEDKPAQIQKLEQAIDEAGDLLAGLVLLARVKAEDLDAEYRH